MAIYELTGTALKDFFQSCIDKKTHDFEIDSYHMTQIFMSETQGDPVAESTASDNWWMQDNREPAQYHVAQYHIRIKDIAKDFMEKVLCDSFLETLISMMSPKYDPKNVKLVVTKNVVLFLKYIIQTYIVKMSDKEYELYIKILRESANKTEFTKEDLYKWCGYDNTSHDEIYETDCLFDGMVRKGIYSCHADGNAYSLNT